MVFDQSKTDVKFGSISRILVEGVGSLHHPPRGWYRAEPPLPESRKFDFSAYKHTSIPWRRTKFDSDRVKKYELNETSIQAQGLDWDSVVWLRSSGSSAQSPRAVHRLPETLPGKLATDEQSERASRHAACRPSAYIRVSFPPLPFARPKPMHAHMSACACACMSVHMWLIDVAFITSQKMV